MDPCRRLQTTWMKWDVVLPCAYGCVCVCVHTYQLSTIHCVFMLQLQVLKSCDDTPGYSTGLLAASSSLCGHVEQREAIQQEVDWGVKLASELRILLDKTQYTDLHTSHYISVSEFSFCIINGIKTIRRDAGLCCEKRMSQTENLCS